MAALDLDDLPDREPGLALRGDPFRRAARKRPARMLEIPLHRRAVVEERDPGEPVSRQLIVHRRMREEDLRQFANVVRKPAGHQLDDVADDAVVELMKRGSGTNRHQRILPLGDSGYA